MRRWIPFFALLMALLLYDCTKSPDFKLVTLPDIGESYEAGPLTQVFLVGKLWEERLAYTYKNGAWKRIGGDGGPNTGNVSFQSDGTVKTHYRSKDLDSPEYEPDHFNTYSYSILPESHLLTIEGRGVYVTYPVSDKSFLLRLDNQLFLYSDVTGIMDF